VPIGNEGNEMLNVQFSILIRGEGYRLVFPSDEN